MEKQRIKSVSKSFRRLLIFFVLILNSSEILFSQTITAAEINLLRITQAPDQQLYTKSDIRFEVVIPKIKPSQIQIISTNLPRDVNFKTMRKSEDFENNGTKLELWYNFDKKGTYQLPALPVMIQNRRRNIRFDAITVTDDPAKQSPQLVVVFENGFKISSNDDVQKTPLFDAKVGTKQTFTVYVQYISQVVKFSWDIPKDSIFTETKTYDITEIKYREKNYTHALIPVASFEWTALSKGALPIVNLKALVTDYSGYRSELYLPETYINFTENSVSSVNPDDFMFDDAFAQKTIENHDNQKKIITQEDCEHLARLYSQERNSIFHFSKNHEQRIDFENSLGIPSTSEGDFTIGFLHIAGLASFVILIFLIIFIRRKNVLVILIFTVLFIFSLVPLINYSVKYSDTYAICKGTTIHSVPEEKSEAVSEIGAGNRVHITEKAGRWVYIEFGETGGWGLKDNVIFIK